MDVIINHHRWGKPACTQASYHIEGKTEVLGSPPHRNIKVPLQSAQDLLPPAHIARRTHTYLDGVPSTGDHGKEIIERNDTVDLAGRYAQPLCDDLLHLHGEIPVVILNFLLRCRLRPDPVATTLPVERFRIVKWLGITAIIHTVFTDGAG